MGSLLRRKRRFGQSERDETPPKQYRRVEVLTEEAQKPTDAVLLEGEHTYAELSVDELQPLMERRFS